MEAFLNLLGFILAVGYFFLISGAIHLHNQHKENQSTFYNWKHLGIMLGVLLALGMTSGGIRALTGLNNSNSTRASNSTESADASSESSQSEESLDEPVESSEEPQSDDSDEDPYAALSSKKREELNQSLDNELITDQEEAENGEDAYAWSLFVGGIGYDKSRGFIVKVNDNFQQLTDANKTLVGHSVQSFIQAQLLMIGGDVQPDDPSPYINFHYGYDRVGHSKMWDPGKFKFSKS